MSMCSRASKTLTNAISVNETFLAVDWWSRCHIMPIVPYQRKVTMTSERGSCASASIVFPDRCRSYRECSSWGMLFFSRENNTHGSRFHDRDPQFASRILGAMTQSWHIGTRDIRSRVIRGPYCITNDKSDVHGKSQGQRSKVKVQGHRVKKIVEFDPDWAFPDCNSSLNSPMATKWLTKLEVAWKRCPIVFQGGHPWNCKVTQL